MLPKVDLLNQCSGAITEINELLNLRDNKQYITVCQIEKLGDRYTLMLNKYDKDQPLTRGTIMSNTIGEFNNKYHLYLALDAILRMLIQLKNN